MDKESMAKVARAVTGDVDPGQLVPFIPSFSNGHPLIDQRSQALALIEWLADYAYKNAGTEMSYAVMMLVSEKNIPALLALALELLESGDG